MIHITGEFSRGSPERLQDPEQRLAPCMKFGNFTLLFLDSVKHVGKCLPISIFFPLSYEVLSFFKNFAASVIFVLSLFLFV